MVRNCYEVQGKAGFLMVTRWLPVAVGATDFHIQQERKRERHRERDFKKLAHANVGAGKSAETGRLETQARADVATPVQRPSEGRIPSSSRDLSLLLGGLQLTG